MMSKERFITINHLDAFGGYEQYRVGETLTLIKDLDNPYDDEAILVKNQKGKICGYVANSVSTVARGTHSAGRIYDQIDNSVDCKILFITEDIIIAKVL